MIFSRKKNLLVFQTPSSQGNAAPSRWLSFLHFQTIHLHLQVLMPNGCWIPTAPKADGVTCTAGPCNDHQPYKDATNIQLCLRLSDECCYTCLHMQFRMHTFILAGLSTALFNMPSTQHPPVMCNKCRNY